MKIDTIKITGFQAIRQADIKLTQPLAMLCGDNEVGKSSIAEAIRLAFIGEAARVQYKKDYGALVNDGADDSRIEITAGNGAWAIHLPSGYTQHSELVGADFARACIVPAYFAGLSPESRRAFLFNLMGLKAGGEEIAGRLLQRGCDKERIPDAMKYVRLGGFEAGAKMAAEKATKAKGEWRAHTGENYGERKAEGWKKEYQGASAVDTEALVAERNDVDAAMEKLNQTIGAIQTQRHNLTARNAHVSALQRLVDQIEVRQAVLDKAKEAQDEHAVALKALQDEAGGIEGEEHTCPKCQTLLLLVKGKLIQLVAGKKKANPATKAKLPMEERKAASLADSMVKAQKSVKEAQDAKVQLDGILEQEVEPGEVGTTDLEYHVAELHELKDKRERISAQIRVAEDTERAYTDAHKRTVAAATAHREVQAWTAIAEALSPDGIPGELLKDSLQPFNDRLTLTSMLADWKPLTIRGDMEIIVTEDNDVKRPYGMVSDSAKWRADALIAEAISFLSGFKLLVLDRFDVNSSPNRIGALKLFSELADEGEIDTVLMLGTMKEPPRGPPNMESFWLEDGVVKPVAIKADHVKQEA